jgi:hypothetical protein
MRRSPMRMLASALVMLCGLLAADGPALAQQSCKVCADQKKACMKNYAGPTCSTEYTMCMKSCKK